MNSLKRHGFMPLVAFTIITLVGSLLYHYQTLEVTAIVNGATRRLSTDESNDPRWRNISCRSTTTHPSFKICLHDVWKDIHVSRRLESTGSWEGFLLHKMGDLLKRDKHLGLIDAGANIGFYALYAAALGRKVIAIEPFEDNLIRLKKAIQLNNFNHLITVLPNFVSDRRGVGLIQKHPDNQGDTRIRMDGVPCVGNCNRHTSTDIEVESICLDDLADIVQTKRAIMKIDIQGYEHLAFQNASRLLDDVFIPQIFMEWVMMKQVKEPDLVKEMISLFLRENYRPYSLQNIALDFNKWDQWPFDMFWKYEI